MNKIIKKGKQIFFSPQSSVISAATTIMLMIVASRILGLVRQRVLAHFFVPEDLSLFFAAFRLPDLIFEVLVFGTFSSAFIPVFTKSLKKGESEAWDTAARVVNIGLIIFIPLALIFSFKADLVYSYMAPGFTLEQTHTIAAIARVLFAAQAFFVVSYVLTGVLESLRIFLVPALAPVFYNLGIIAGTVAFSNSLGLMAPAVGVLIGAAFHFLIQLPASIKLGFRFGSQVKPNADVKKIGRLALPRVVDLSFQQIAKTVELYFASLLSVSSYTYFTFANTLQLLPVGLFGTSVAKAALPTLARMDNDLEKFRKTLFSVFAQMVFLITPLAVMLIVLRIPFVRLVYGTDIFGWKATVQTGFVLSAFAIGVPAQASVMLLNRAFYALHDTRTPMAISLAGTSIATITSMVLILGFGYPTWALGVAFSAGVIFQFCCLYFFLSKKINGGSFFGLMPILKSLTAGLVSGMVMFFLLKFFDRSAWVKRLSFLTNLEAVRQLNFEAFVLDTRYSVNLLILSTLTALIGLIVYVVVSFLLRSTELMVLIRVIRTKSFVLAKTKKETISPTASDTTEL